VGLLVFFVRFLDENTFLADVVGIHELSRTHEQVHFPVRVAVSKAF